MSLTDPFKLLGLDRATATEADVKRAYAKKLKETRPEEDRDGFMALRQAFTLARRIAKNEDVSRAAPDASQDSPPAPPDAAPKAADPEPQTKPQPQPEVTWTHHNDIRWRLSSNAQGQLILRSLRWMQAGGPDGDGFVQTFGDSLAANPDIDKTAVMANLCAFLNREGSDEYAVEMTPDWQEFDLTRPTWLTDDMIRILTGPIGLFDFPPTKSAGARVYNNVLALFKAARPEVIHSRDNLRPLDVKAMYASEMSSRGDSHGLYFDPEQMVWVDNSPAGLAMQDFRAEIDKGREDIAQRIAQILARDAVQPLDAYQALSEALHNLVCTATGVASPAKSPVFPEWLTPDLVVLLDKTFGWSRQYGRDRVQRQRADWMHRVLSGHIEIERPGAQFEAQDQTSPERYKSPLAKRIAQVIVGFYENPHRLLLGYLGYRLALFVVRLAV